MFCATKTQVVHLKRFSAAQPVKLSRICLHSSMLWLHIITDQSLTQLYSFLESDGYECDTKNPVKFD